MCRQSARMMGRFVSSCQRGDDDAARAGRASDLKMTCLELIDGDRKVQAMAAAARHNQVYTGLLHRKVSDKTAGGLQLWCCVPPGSPTTL